MKPMGRRQWVIPGGYIPLNSTGHEPEFTSQDKLSFLNLSDEEAQVEITIFYTDREPVGPYTVTILARRVRKVKLNDLIDPEAIFLDTDYACVVASSAPVVVQFSRLDSSQRENALAGTIAFSQTS